MSGEPWTQVETGEARFPSAKCAISGPSRPDAFPGGPFFFLDADTYVVRISWKEFQGNRTTACPSNLTS